jgi:hypothetical protein
MTMRIACSTALVIAAFAVRATSALAQGCAMCGSSFSENDPTTQAFNSSVVFLMITPYVIFFAALGCVALLYRRGVVGRRGNIVPFSRRRMHLPADGPKEVTP